MRLFACRVGRPFTDCHGVIGSCVQSGWSDNWRSHWAHALHGDSCCRGSAIGNAYLAADCCSSGWGAVSNVCTSQRAQQSSVRAGSLRLEVCCQKTSLCEASLSNFDSGIANAHEECACKAPCMALSSAKPLCRVTPLAQSMPSKQAMKNPDRNLQGICQNTDSILRGATRSELHQVKVCVKFKWHTSRIKHAILFLSTPDCGRAWLINRCRCQILAAWEHSQGPTAAC